jgi:hypothetical protein
MANQYLSLQKIQKLSQVPVTDVCNPNYL